MAQESYADLKARADTYYLSCELLSNSGNSDLAQNALEAIHLALELAMKALIRKNGGTYPDQGGKGHDLEVLLNWKWNGRQSLAGILIVRKVTSFANITVSQWSMDCRYRVLQNTADTNQAINEYKGFYLWIKSNLLT